MASIAASPGFPDGLKKRSRLMTSETYELSRLKRYRGASAGEYGAATASNENAMNDEDAHKDVPKYTQRHVDYFEQVKQAEIARIRAEYEQYIMKKDVEFQQCRQELGRLQEHAQHQDKELHRLHEENKLLKRAVNIQNQQKGEIQQENTVLKSLATQAAEHIKRLEQTNYALRVHLQTSTSSGRSSDHSHPPDVY
ncbi:hypothetical protein Poli38472_012930 [Pythium oligandrum]|uniref:Uncharacterized protein n=1 Tax=Pythium oligandrum TaxID=41045 RepID=A0A8K1CJX3_PYTOL|nr:hypothetical protein Poli38472_012930 [Pythium oligandrum]|eukprot:TMW64308.1 hypothetical protein Poli38472_012930 [Pythium oligandrum]